MLYTYLLVCLWARVCIFKSHWGWRCLQILCDIDENRGPAGTPTLNSWSSTHMTGTDWWDLWEIVCGRWRHRGKRWTPQWTTQRKWRLWPGRTSVPLTMFSSSPEGTLCVWPEPIVPKHLIIHPSRLSKAVCKRCSTLETPKIPPTPRHTSSPRLYRSFWSPFLPSIPHLETALIQLQQQQLVMKCHSPKFYEGK